MFFSCMQHKAEGAASLAEGAAVYLLVKAGIWNLAMVPVIACLLFTKDTHGIFNIHKRMLANGRLFNVHPWDGTHIDESPACETPG